MAAQLEDAFNEETALIQSSGGVFEVEDRGRLIFSKKNEHRFPEESEIISIVQSMEQGQDLQEARAAASREIPKPPTFLEWFTKKINLR